MISRRKRPNAEGDAGPDALQAGVRAANANEGRDNRTGWERTSIMCLTPEGSEQRRDRAAGRCGSTDAAVDARDGGNGLVVARARQWHPPAQRSRPTSRSRPTRPWRSDWPVSHAYWANGTVVAGPKRFPYTYATQSGTGEYGRIILDSLMFVYQTLRCRSRTWPTRRSSRSGTTRSPTSRRSTRSAAGPGERLVPQAAADRAALLPVQAAGRADDAEPPPPTGPTAFQRAPPTTGEATRPAGDMPVFPATSRRRGRPAATPEIRRQADPKEARNGKEEMRKRLPRRIGGSPLDISSSGFPYFSDFVLRISCFR